MFSVSSIPQIKSNYDRNIAFSSQEQEFKASFTGLTSFGFKSVSLIGSGCPSLLTRGPHVLGDTMEHLLFAKALMSHARFCFQGTQLTLSLSNLIFFTPSVSFTE